MRMTFAEFSHRLNELLPLAQSGNQDALVTIAEWHETAYPFSEIRRALAAAWWTIVCESATATATHRKRLAEANEILFEEEITHAAWLIDGVRNGLAQRRAAGEWTLTVSPSDEDFLTAWLRYYETEAGGNWDIDGWTTTLVSAYGKGELAPAWRLTEELLNRHKTENQLGMIGVTLLEDMCWTHIAETPALLVPLLRDNPALVRALSCVWISNTNPRRKYIVEEWLKQMAHHGLRAEDVGHPYLPCPVELVTPSDSDANAGR